MAMRTASKAPAHGKSGSTGSTGSLSMSYPLPASPTLTNPDMILPDYDYGASSPDRSQSPLMTWKITHAVDMQQFDLSAQPYPSGAISPTTPIIYGNGTMLSDIGEVTEAESIREPMRLRNAPRNGQIQHQIPMPVYQTIKKQPSRERERRLSMESTSTITNGDQSGLFADFDDAVSVDDSNFQGDDEESVAESYIYDNASVVSAHNVGLPQSYRMYDGLGLAEEDRYSTALSRRAEQILANAKRRLTTMEGNLTRARTSLSSAGSGSTPSPTIGRPATALHTDHDTDSIKRAHGHTRVSSESYALSDIRPDTAHSPRAASALGAAGGYRQPLQISRSADYIRDSTQQTNPKGNSVYVNAFFSKSKSSLHDSKHTLEPLSEDEVHEGLDSSRPSLEVASLDSFLSPTFGSFGDTGLKRSASTAQMRDLKDQMQDLKGRMSSLRDQARVDSMKRRSLSNLRTPSPFTHAPSYGDVNHEQDIQLSKSVGSPPNGEVMSTSSGSTSSAGNQRTRQSLGDKPRYNSHSELEQSSSQTLLSPPTSRPQSPDQNSVLVGFVDIVDEDDANDRSTEDGHQDDEADEVDDSYSDSGESSYHDSVQNQLSHEDREDAFDYEHFFLHSAMGSMSQKRLETKGRRDSYSSEDSVETTRGPSSTPTDGNSKWRSRRGSNVSTSTLDSFATATEGRFTRIDYSEAEEAEEDHAGQAVTSPERPGSQSPGTAKRAIFSINSNDVAHARSDKSQPRVSVIRRPQSSAAMYAHRPSVSSFDSTGTHRSFPLVNHPKVNGILTPGDSPDDGLNQISETIMSETASICEGAHGDKAPIEMLHMDDQILVERLVASLGRCVLGLTESGRASAESRMFRKRIDTARRMLEGIDQAIQ